MRYIVLCYIQNNSSGRNKNLAIFPAVRMQLQTCCLQNVQLFASANALFQVVYMNYRKTSAGRYENAAATFNYFEKFFGSSILNLDNHLPCQSNFQIIC